MRKIIIVLFLIMLLIGCSEQKQTEFSLNVGLFLTRGGTSDNFNVELTETSGSYGKSQKTNIEGRTIFKEVKEGLYNVYAYKPLPETFQGGQNSKTIEIFINQDKSIVLEIIN